MKTVHYHSGKLIKLFKKQKIATMPELQFALGTNIDMTVFRKLKELSYQTSYSHRGKYYTLNSIVCFNEQGIWQHNSVFFSKYGNLITTVETFVKISESGYSTEELKKVLNVEVKEPLLHLYRQNRIHREKISTVYIYFSNKPIVRKRQISFRLDEESELSGKLNNLGEEILANELKAAVILFFSLLNEKQRRLYAGLESLKIGYGGDSIISELLNSDIHTVAKGREELLNSNVERERIRQKGGGRYSVKKNTTNHNKN